jgi:polyhydroxyalkanoate synthesis regulator phasin
MASRSGGSRSGGSKSTGAKSRRSRSAGSTSTSRSGATRKRSSTASRPASRKRSSTTGRRKPATGRTPAAGRSDKSVQAFRDALERSRGALESNLTLSRERIQEVVDEAVERGRMTRGDANKLVSNLVSHGRKASDDLMRDLEKLLEQARTEVESRTGPARRQARSAAGRAARSVRDAADRPLAEADRLRRRTGAPGPPITGYDQLTASQVKSRLKDLNKAELRKVRTQERRGKARQGILNDIERRLEK